MPAPLTGKAAIVTGGSGGIGACISRRLAADGCAVAVHYLSHRAKAQAIVDAIVAEGRALAVGGDVADEQDARRIVAETLAAFDRLDILVNNAGTIIRGPMGLITKAELVGQFSTNVIGLMLMCQEAMRHLPERSGRIVNISSNLSVNAPATGVAYAASKAAVNAVTVGLARELGPRGITVNAVAPGGTRTDMLADLDPSVLDQIIATTPLGRLGEPEDIADVVAFFVSDAARWITGRTLVVDGGWI